KQKNKKKQSNRLSSAKNSIRGAKDILYAVSESRQKLHHNEVAQFSEWALKGVARKEFSRLLFPRKISQLETSPLLKPIGRTSSALWSAGLFSTFSHQLNQYLEQRSLIESQIICDDYEGAIETLEALFTKLGYSMWG